MKELLLKLQEFDVQLNVDDDKLKLNLPKDFKETSLIEEIKESKIDLIEYLNKEKKNKVNSIEIPKVEFSSTIKLTPPQARLYVLQGLAQDSNVYNIPFACELNGVVDVAQMKESFVKMIQRHESLRTSFILGENYEPVQKVHENFDFELEYIKSNEKQLDNIIQEFSYAFNLEKAPLIRAKLIEVKSNKFVLLIDVHHIIFDGISTQIFLKDLMSLYNKEDVLDLKLQYRDYTSWYYSDDYQINLAAQKSFWLKELNGFSNTAILPADFKKSNKISFEGAYADFKIDAKRKQVIKKLAKKYEVSLFSVLITFYSILQAKLTGVNDLAIGIPVAGRRHWSLDNMIGMFVNTLAVRMNPKNEIGFDDYLKAVGSRIVQSFDNQEYPYEKLLDDLNLRSNNEMNPLFNTLITLSDIEQTTQKVNELDIELIEIKKSTSKFDLVMHFNDIEDELECTFEYTTQLFKKKTIERFFDYFIAIIDQVEVNESIAIEEITLLDKKEARRVIQLNDFTDVNYPRELTLIEIFENQVAKTPNNIALVFGNDTMTYQELNKKANQLGRMLRTKGVGRNEAVGVLMEKNVQAIISMLGILKAGGAYVPIDVNYPQNRIDYIVENSDFKWAISTKEYVELINKKEVLIINMSEVESVSRDTSNLEVMNSPNDLCYVIYTSGTTGVPKGVMIEHKNVVRLLINEDFQYDFTENDVWTMFHSHCFDVSVWEMYGALLYGGKLIIVSQPDARDPLKYIEILKENKVTILNQTPTAFYSLNNVCEKENIMLPAIRYVVFAGEALTPSKLSNWKSLYPDTKLINMYGITEVTVHMTYKEIGEEEIQNGTGNVGKALPTGSIYLLDSNMQPVPEGVIGEIYVGGAGVARGYMNNKELTDSRFISNPFKKGDRLYKSGDLAVLLENGDLEYKRRSDNQVQLKGFRIELKEIEHHLYQHELINDVLVIKSVSEKEEPFLCAYYISEKELDVNELRTYLKDKLPHYMIPSYYVKLEEMPFTSNNKIDTSKLPEPKTGVLGNSYVAPVSEKEKIMCRIWEEEFALEQVGLRDNYFSLGGDSLKAIGLISKLNEALELSLSIADLYSYQTIEELMTVENTIEIDEKARALETAKEELRMFQEKYKKENDFLDEYEEVYPMNGVEMGMVFLSLQTRSDNVEEILYHEQNLYDFPWKDFSFETFKQTIKLVCEKHGELRKIFDLDNLAHIIKRTIDPEINFIDIQHLSKNEQEIFIAKKMEEEKLRGTELSFSLIWRMNVIKIRDDYQYLLFDFNHALFDGWSLSSFLTETQKVYLSLLDDKNYKPVKLQSSYEDQIIGELAASNIESTVSYWKKELDGYTRFELPATGVEHKFLSNEFNLGKSYRQQLEQVAIQHNTSFKHLCFSAYIYMLRMLSYGNDITTGIATNIRPLTQDAEQLLGCFLNTIPVRINIPEGLTWGGYIDFVENKLRELKYHERAPFHKVLEFINEDRSEKNPIFDIFFNFIDFRIFKELQPFEESIEEEETSLSKDYLNDHGLLTTHIFAHDNDFSLAFTYSTSFITEEQVIILSNYFKNILDQFIQHSDVLMKKQVILDQSINTLKLPEFNNTEDVKYPEELTIVSLFEEQVLKNPKKQAIVFENRSLTYFELNNLANLVANSLRSKGVGRDSIVGLLMDKNLHTVVCQLGILKSGGCYLPIDPSYPKERINYIIEDSNLNILVTNKAYEDVLEASIYQVVLEDVLASNTGKEEVSNPECINTPEDMCYIIYTSGTTGNPKGVMVEHRNVVRLFFNDSFQFEFGKDDVWTMFHSHCFDFSVWEMYGALLYGGKLVVISQSEARDPFRYVEILKEHKVTVLNQTPTAFDSLRNVCAKENIILSSLRYVIFGGEALTPLKLKDWYGNHPEVKLVNMYGITEITVHATYKEIGKEEIENNISNIGKPIPTTSLYLLDSDRNVQPQGVIGEIYIGGSGVARGYLNKEELTASRFIENPYQEGERLYRSGDLGRLLKNGEVEYLGRIDTQVQLKGFRIELKEIEHHLLQHNQLTEVVVVMKDSDKEKPYLCAYYVSNDTTELNDLRVYLSEYLPNYMIPSYYVKLEEMPFTSNNKIDVSKLPEPGSGLLKDNYVAPTNEKERQMCKVWEEEFALEQVGLKDNYFSLGGDSLKAISLISRLNKELELSLSIADLYSYQTIEELVTVKNTAKVDEKAIAIEAAREELRIFQENYKKENDFSDTYEQVYPMNGVEMGMVFHSLQTKSNTIEEILYHEQNLYDFPLKDFSFKTFKQAINIICEKHGELRKIFDLDNLAHIIKRTIDPEINFIDIQHLNKDEQEIFMDQKMEEEKLRGTELSFSLIWRMNIIKIREDYQYLLFDFNHALFDGWSLSSFLTELQKVYLSLSNNKNYVPTKLQSSYEDQIIGELAASNIESTVSYWKKELDGYTRFELPATGAEHKFIRDEFNIGKAYRQQLEQVAIEHNTSFKHLCFSAYIYMLRMLVYGNDITVGITTNVRPLVQDAEQLLGCFLNTIPVRVNIPEGLTWGEYINFVENKLRELKYHENIPFHKILEITNEISNSNNPVFDVSFNYVDFRVFKELQPFEDSIAEEETSLNKAYMNDYALLGVHIHAFDDDFSLELNYSTSFISETQAKIASSYFKSILEQFIEHANSPMNKLVILENGEASLNKINRFNSTAVDYGEEKTVLDLFKEQVKKVPNQPALFYEESVLTYSQLDLKSTLWAKNLIISGITPGSIVALRMTRSIEMITAILAVFKTGATYMILDSHLPETRVAYMMDESGSDYIITNIKERPLALDNYKWLNIYALNIENDVSVTIKLPNVISKSSAYILYTSGSTGNPKGCMISHANLYNYISWSNEYYFDGLEEGNWGLMTQMSFDLSVTAIFTSLTKGKKLYLCDETKSIDVLLEECFNNPQIDTLKLTPTHVSILKDLEIIDTNIKNVICGGEQLKKTHVEILKSIDKNIKIYNEYGPTETTVGCSVAEISLLDELITVGKPIANTKIYILDENRQSVPIGVTGEIFVSGAGVSQGYKGNVLKTSKVFVKIQGEVCYKTGDLGRWDSKGDIEYLGRIDDQIKIRGFRIEPNEIEAVLEKNSNVSRAIVSVYGEKENKKLCAYITGKVEPQTDELKETLSKFLPEYMIPDSFIWMEDFPVTSNGKIDHKALPNPEIFSVELYIAPETQQEHQMVHIWAEILDLDESVIGVNDNFFQLGGHSLRTIKLKNRINKEFSVSIDIKDVFTHYSVKTLLAHMESLEETAYVSIPKAKPQLSYPLSSAQRRMYFLYEFDKKGTTYNMPGFYKIQGKVDISKLELAFNSLVKRHQSFRTIFNVVDGNPVQYILSADSFAVKYSTVDAIDVDTHIKNFVVPFNLSKELPIRVNLLKIKPDDYLLMVDMHHIINDGVSQGIWMRDFWSLYKGEILPELSIQYTDYAIWQQDEVHEELVATHKSYWLERYEEELTSLELPTDYVQPLQRSAHGAEHSVRLSKSQSAKLRALANANGVTMYTLFLAIYNVLLSKLSNQDDIVIGTATAGRHHTDLEGLVGMFVNTLALRNQVVLDSTFKAFLANVQEDTLKAFDHQLYQYEDLVEALDISRDTSRNPLFDVFYSYDKQEINNSSFSDSDLKIVSNDSEYNIAKFDLSLSVLDVEEINVAFNYRTDLFEHSSIERFAGYLDLIISQVLKDETQLLRDINILSEEEQTLLKVGFNNTSVNYDINKTVLDLFKDQVLLRPNEDALIFEGVHLTYKELDLKSTHIAKMFILSGIKQGSVVALRMRRSIEMISTIVAVMKTGASYMIIDPSLPNSRVIHMMEESTSKLIITNIKEQSSELEAYSLINIEELERGKKELSKVKLPEVSSANLAYILYTSGSTGKPKGCMISHANLYNYISWSNDYYFENPEQGNWGLITPMSFDLTVTSIFTSLTRGKKLYIGNEGKSMDQLLKDCFNNLEIDTLKLTPTHITILKDLNIQNTNVKTIICGGEQLKKSHIEIIKNINKDIKVFNEYGPTETTVGCIVTQVNNTDAKVSIGYPIANTKIHILGVDQKIVPLGVTGEIYISGSGVSKGYINNAELTSERFVVIDSTICYKTGDLARWNLNGSIEYLGRIDDQIKVRGFRIEPGEIETVLENQNEIKQAFITDYGVEENKQLIAYLFGEEELDDHTIKSLLSSKLPDYMIPNIYIWLDSLPLTSNGKIDKRGLPSPELTKGEEYVAPQTEDQKQLVNIWSEVLGIENEKISVTSNFFSLGGHSLLAMKLKYEIKKHLKVELPLSEIFLASTIIALSNKIREWEIKDDNVIILPLNNRDVEDKLFIIHDGSGEIDGYLELTRNIDRYECYGVKFDQFETIDTAPDIKEIASKYIKEIKTIQPFGPYRLLGWSLGGEIAVEMTSQIESSGEKVENLIVVDSALKYNQPLENTPFNVSSEIEVLKSMFEFSFDDQKMPNSLNDLWLQFIKSETFRVLSIDKARNVLPENMRQLMPDFLNKSKEELFLAANKIRLLIASSENHFINTIVKANTLYIRPSQSDAIQNMEVLSEYFLNLDIQHVSGDHFSVMKKPAIMDLLNIMENYLGSNSTTKDEKFR